MVRVHDGVADLEVDALGLGKKVLVEDLVDVNSCVGNGWSSWSSAARGPPSSHVCR
jgi:hypothetical protein